MPAPVHPGVYSEDVPAGVRVIARAPTSIAAFVGRAPRGRVGVAVEVRSPRDFQRAFGGLWAGSRLGFAVCDFFRNGGSQAVVVRVFNPDPRADAAMQPAVATLDANGLLLQAVSPGSWGNALRARIEAADPRNAEAIARTLGVDPVDLFTLRVRDTAADEEEMFTNITAVDSTRRIDRLLATQSNLVRVRMPLATPAPHADPDPHMRLWDDANASSGVVIHASDGLPLDATSVLGNADDATGLHALAQVDLFNLLCIPPYAAADGVADQDVDSAVVGAAAGLCEARRAFLIVDPPSGWGDIAHAAAGVASLGTRSGNAAVYFPRLLQANPLRAGAVEAFAPCGAIAGVMARTDSTRGVWASPAGLESGLRDVVAPSVPLPDRERDTLNRRGVNGLLAVVGKGTLVWGARTLQGDDSFASQWTYIAVRRLALHIEESLLRGTQWAVFEPNGEPLWAQLRRAVDEFLHALFREGAFKGTTPAQAWYVRCGEDTISQMEMLDGIVDIEVGFAPLKPSEFVVLRLRVQAPAA